MGLFKKQRFSAKSVAFSAGLILLMALFSLQGAWAAGFGVTQNKVTITTKDGATTYDYTPTVDQTGLVPSTDLNAMQGTALDSITIGLFKDNVADGTHIVDLGIIVDDADNQRRIEAFLPGIQVVVAGSSTSVTVPAGSNLRIAGRSNDGATTFITTIENLSANGPVTAVGNTIVFSLTNLQEAIQTKFGGESGNSDILNSFAAEGRYAYTILVKSPANVPIGFVSGSTVTPFTSYNIGPGTTQYGLNLANIKSGQQPIGPIAIGTTAEYLNGLCYVLRGAYGVGTGNNAPAPGALPTLNSVPPAPPTLTDLLPNTGLTLGGEVVTITGTNFRAGITVSFGTVIASSVTLVSGTQLRCTAPAHATNVPVSITVTNTDGSTVTGLTYTYTLPRPSLSGVSPASGPSSGGTPVTLSGNNFVTTGTTTVKFGTADATNVVVGSSTSITCTAPPKAAADPLSVMVKVTNPDGKATLENKTYTYVLPPVLASVTPNTGFTEGGQTVVLAGQNFAQGATVTFGTKPASSVTFNSSTQITCVTPANPAGAANVAVKNPDGQIDTKTGGFNYETPVRADFSATPISGPAPLPVTFTDRSVGDTTWSWNFGDGQTATVETPLPHTYNTPGEYTVTLTIDGGVQVQKVNYIHVLDPVDIDPPTASFVSGAPAEGTTTNRTSYTITVGGQDVTQYAYSVDGGSTWTLDGVTPWVGPINKGDAGILVATAINLSGLGIPASDYVTYTLQIRGRDQAGNWQGAGTARTWKIDTKPPTAVLSNLPEAESELYINAFSAAVSGTDVQQYQYSWDSGASWSGTQPVGARITDMPAGNGRKDLWVIGLDSYGNWQAKGDATKRGWWVNNTIPTAVLTVDSSTPIASGGLFNIRVAKFTVGGDQVTGYRYLLKKQGITWDPVDDKGLLVSDVGWRSTVPINLTALPDGKYKLFVNATNGTNWQDQLDGTTETHATTFEWTVDGTPPINTTLTATAGTPATTSVSLSWTSVETGLNSYRLRYSTTGAITATNWDSASAVPIVTGITPGVEGVVERYLVTGLLSNTPYWFGLRSEDAAGNPSGIATASFTTTNNRPQITSFARTDGAGFLPNGTWTGTNDLPIELTVTGNNFAVTAQGTANIVKFVSTTGSGGFNATSIGGTASTLYVDVPVGATPGTYNLQVTNSNGTSPFSSQAYAVKEAPVPLPEVSLISPATGANTTDTLITINGKNFTGATGVAIKKGDTLPFNLGAPAPGGTSTRLTATIPAGRAAGVYDIQVTTGSGTNSVSTHKFEVYAPQPIAANQTEEISTNQGVDLPDLPPADPKAGVIPAQLSLKSETSDQAAAISQNKVEIAAEFQQGTSLTVGGTAYMGTINPPRQVPVPNEKKNKLGENAVVFTMGIDQGTIQLGAGQVIEVKLDVAVPIGSKVPTIYYLDTVTGDIKKAGIDPSNITHNNHSVRIEGFKKKYGISYTHGGVVLSSAVDSPEEGFITYHIAVLLDHMSEFSAAALMDITGVTPSSGTIDGGTPVTISGANFQDGSTVAFDGASATAVSVAPDGTSITCATPAHVEGTVDIVVTGPDTVQTASLAGGFTYLVIPSIAGISPTSGSTAGGTSVAITGANFMPGVTVTFDNIPAEIVDSSPITINCKTPIHSAGAVNVVVTNPNAESATAANAFTFIASTPPPGPGPGPGPAPVPRDNETITASATIPTGTSLTGNTVNAGVTVTNNGTMTNLTNNGIVVGGTIGGTVTNTNGTVQNATLATGAILDGGRITGNITALGEGATITNAVIDATSLSNVTIGSGCRVTQNTIDNNPDLDLTLAVTGPGETIRTATPLLVDVDDAGNTLTLADLIKTEANQLLVDGTCTILDDAAGNTILSADNLGNLVVPSVITSVVTTSDPDGASVTADGELLMVRNGIALTMAPASADEASFEAALQGFGATYAPDSDHVVTISLPDGADLVLRFNNFAVRPGSAASIAAVGGTFSLEGDPADPASYSLVITYPDGTSQSMPPFIHALRDFRGLARDAGMTYQVVPSSGVIEVMGADGAVTYRGRPDYFLAAPTAGDTGLSFDFAGDVNGDGLEDIYMITPSGRQILYTLPLN